MPALDKAKVRVAAHNKSHFDLSGTHVTTTNFLQLQPVYYRHMIPGEKISVNANAFSRLAPMAVPTFGRARLNMRAFFVPFRTVFPNATEFFTDSLASNSSATSLVSMSPVVQNDVLYDAFANTSFIGPDGTSHSWATNHGSTEPSSYDFFNGSDYYSFTKYGRQAYKVLRSLGYQIDWNKTNTTQLSALPILSFARVYLDWYAASSYQDTSTYGVIQQLFNYDNPSSYLQLTPAQMSAIFSFLLWVVYDGDYFTAAWDNPVGPNSGLGSSFVVPDPTVSNSDIPNGTYFANIDRSAYINNELSSGTPAIGVVNPGSKRAVVSQYALDALRALTDYVKRHQLVGARAVDRYLAEFGINLHADKLRRSIYLGNNSIDIQIGDVMSHTNTAAEGDPSTLGDYAGRGFANGSKTFDYECEEFGLFLICASILPSGGYVQGIDRNNLHIQKLDFFTNEFDSLSVQAIAKGEVYVPIDGTFYSSGNYNGIFGYTPRYAEYKVGRDILSGDLSLNSFAGQDAWHLFRMFDGVTFPTESDVVHSLSFVRGVDGEQYNRIFQNTFANADKFTVVYQFNVGSYAPCKSLFDTYDFEEGGKTIAMDSNGTKMN